MLKKLFHNGLFLVTLTAITGGLNTVIVKVALQQFPIFTFTLVRFMLASLLLLPIFINRKVLRSLTNKRVLVVSTLPVFNLIFFGYGIRLTTATSAQILYTASPLVTLFLGYFFFSQRLTKNQFTGIFVGFLGVLTIILQPYLFGKNLDAGSLEGNLLIFGGVLTFALYTLLSKPLQKEHPPLNLTFVFFVFTIAISSLLIIPEWQIGLPPLNQSVISSLLYVGVCGTAGFYILYQYLIKNTEPINASLTFYLMPIAALLGAYILLGEKLTVLTLVGGCVTLFGVYLANKPTS